MRLCIHLSGSTIFETVTDAIPHVGSVVRFRTESYKKGLYAGSVVQITVTGDDPPEYDFTDGPGGTVYLNANGYEVIEEGPSPD